MDARRRLVLGGQVRQQCVPCSRPSPVGAGLTGSPSTAARPHLAEYRKHGADIITITSFFSPTPEFAVANAKAIRKLNLDRQTFRSESASRPRRSTSAASRERIL